MSLETLHCARTVCRQPLPRWFNSSTEQFYCAECARLINEGNPPIRPGDGPLCTLMTDVLLATLAGHNPHHPVFAAIERQTRKEREREESNPS